MVSRKNVKKTVHIILGILIFLVIISGMGINYFRSIEILTLGLLNKDLSFQLHSLLFLPLLLILLIHIFFPWLWSKKKDK